MTVIVIVKIVILGKSIFPINLTGGMILSDAPKIYLNKFDKNILIPNAVINADILGAVRKGLYAMRSIAIPINAQAIIESNNNGINDMENVVAKKYPTNAPIIRISPWAKLINLTIP
jgi:hypothetical protein